MSQPLDSDALSYSRRIMDALRLDPVLFSLLLILASFGSVVLYSASGADTGSSIVEIDASDEETANRQLSSAIFCPRVAASRNSLVTTKFSVPPKSLFCVLAIWTTRTACSAERLPSP